LYRVAFEPPIRAQISDMVVRSKPSSWNACAATVRICCRFVSDFFAILVGLLLLLPG